MTKPVPGRAEVAVEYPDKLYIGAFEHTARFEAHADAMGIALSLEHRGTDAERNSVRLHLHYALFAEILQDVAATMAALPRADATHRQALHDAAEALCRALGRDCETNSKDALADLTPQEEVLLLHVLE